MKLLLTTLLLIFQASRCLALTGTVTGSNTLETQFNGTITVNSLNTSVTGTSGGSVRWNLSVATAGDVVYALTGGAYVRVGTVAASPAPSASGLTLTTAYTGTSLSAVNFVIIPKSGTITVEDATLTLSFTQTITDSMICNFVLGKGSGSKSGSVNVNHSTLSLIPTAVTLAASAGTANNITLTSGFLKWRSGVSSAPPTGCSYTYSGGTVVFYPFGGTVGGPFNLNGSSFSSLTIEASSTTSYNAQSAISVSGVLTIPTNATLNMAANTLTLSATGTTLTNGGTISTTAAIPFADSRSSKSYGGTVTLASLNGGQTISGGFTFNNLTLSNTTLTNTLAASAAVTVNGTLTITNANMYLNLNGGTLTVNAFAGSGALTGSAASSVVYTGGTNSTMLMNTTTPGTTNALGNLTLNSNTNLTLGTALSISTALTTTAGGTLALANNRLTLSAGSTLTNAGTISTTMPTATSASWLTDSRNGSGAGTTPGVFSGTISYAASSGAQTIVTGTYENLTLSNTSGTNTTATAITVTGILNSTAGGKIQINSSGSLTLSGTLAQSQVHQINGDIELNGGDFIVSGSKDKDKVVSNLIASPTLPTPPYMIIRGSINDVLTTSFRDNSIRFVPSNSAGFETHIRFAGSGKTLGNSSTAFNKSIQTNDKAYFEIGDGTSSVTLTLQDTLRLNNGLRMKSNATLTTSGMLQLLSSSNKIQGQQKSVGFIDTSVANSIVGSICFVQTMSASRKLRFLGNPFKGDLNIADFTDDIDITGDRTGVNNNNFTQTANNTASAYTYDNATDAWVAITNTSPTKLSSKQGMKILIRGQKGYGLDANNGSPSSARIILNGEAILGDQTISLSNGYNFVCNPFLAPVNLDNISKTTNVADVLYMYNPGSSGFQTFNKNSKAASVGGADIWSAGTSFFFYADGVGESITIEEIDKYNPERKSYNPHFLESDTFYNIANIIIKNDLGRESLVDDITLDLGGRLNASDNYDILYDGLDFGGDSVNVSILSKDNKYLSYCATNPLSNNEIRRYPLSLTIKNNSLNGNYTLQFDQFKAFQSDINVTLVDHWLNKTVDLIKNPQVKFYINDQKESQGLNRFEIVINKAIVSTQELLVNRTLDFIISSNLLNNGLDFTPIAATANNVLLIYDLQGKLIRNYDKFNASVSILNEEMKAGVYLATQICGKAKLTKKFIIIK
ncbi:MAG: hypothetical protein RLZZ512_1034 [Bacteroidota bacterium]|jgi:hypothetical protein